MIPVFCVVSHHQSGFLGERSGRREAPRDGRAYLEPREEPQLVTSMFYWLERKVSEAVTPTVPACMVLQGSSTGPSFILTHEACIYLSHGAEAPGSTRPCSLLRQLSVKGCWELEPEGCSSPDPKLVKLTCVCHLLSPKVEGAGRESHFPRNQGLR